jgi:hypothetical protein
MEGGGEGRIGDILRGVQSEGEGRSNWSWVITTSGERVSERILVGESVSIGGCVTS